MSSALVLLRTLLLTTSQRNTYRHTTDKRKRRRIVANTVGYGILHIMLMAYGILMCAGYGTFGLIDAAPVLCALLVSGLAFVFTLFKTNGYLFNFREYDLLMSLPFDTKTVAACKFMYMYVQSLPWYANVSLSLMIGYGIFAQPSPLVYPVWIVLALILPIIPMLAAAFVGFLVTKVSTGFRHTSLIQTVLTMAFVVVCFSLRFIIEGVVENDQVRSVLEQVSTATSDAARAYPPADWFARAIAGSVPDGLLLVGATALLFAIVFVLVGRSYRRINSALTSHAATGSYRMSAQKQRSAVVAVAAKEYRRMMGSSLYMVNGAMGEVLAALLGIVTLVLGFDQIVAAATQNAPFDPAILRPAIPLIVYFFIGMVATTAFSPSLEGRNYWILQSLPLPMKTVYQGKMLFNMCLTVPAMTFSTLCLCVSAHVGALETALYLVLGLALCAFSTTWGCVCGVRHLRLDWENEIEVIKQGTAVTIYLLPNMFAAMALVALSVFLGTLMSPAVLALALTIVAAGLAATCYAWLMRR